MLAALTGAFPRSVAFGVALLTIGAVSDLGSAKAAVDMARPPAEGRSIAFNDDVLLVGMSSETVVLEARALRAVGARVRVITDSASGADKIAVSLGSGRTILDLQAEGAVGRFVSTLGLPPAQSERIQEVLSRDAGDPLNVSARDELAEIARVWAEAEHGGSSPSRLVLSAHFVHHGFWGDPTRAGRNNGLLKLDSLAGLAKAMPKAAALVEDLHLAACNTGGGRLVKKYRSIFPNLRTIWMYAGGDDGTAPGSMSGAGVHLRLWEMATRGRRADMTRGIAVQTRKGNNVAAWHGEPEETDVLKGYAEARATPPLKDLRARMARVMPILTAFEAGRRVENNPARGELRSAYTLLQEILRHPDLPEDEVSGLERRLGHTVRLLFFAKVQDNFARWFEKEIKQGYASLGIPAPTYGGGANRRETLARILAFEGLLKQRAQPPQAAVELLRILRLGLRDLDPSFVLETWL